MSIKKLGTSVYDSNSSNIVDSTRKDFVSSYQKNKKDKDGVIEQPKNELSKFNEKFVKETVEKTLKEKTTPQDEKAAANLIKNLLKSKLQNLKQNDFRPGNLVLYGYQSVRPEDIIFDRTPICLILSTSKQYILGTNLNWLAPPLRKILIKLIFKINSKNIKENKNIELNYQKIKPLLKQLGLMKVITTRYSNGKLVSNSPVRLYIKRNIKRRGLVIPPEYWLVASNLDASSFTDGYNAKNIYKSSVSSYSKNRIKFYRNRKK